MNCSHHADDCRQLPQVRDIAPVKAADALVFGLGDGQYGAVLEAVGEAEGGIAAGKGTVGQALRDKRDIALVFAGNT